MIIKPIPTQIVGSEELTRLRSVVADGIALGGDYNAVFDSYVAAHNDRKALLACVEELIPALRSAAAGCIACEGTAEIQVDDDMVEACKHCKPAWDLIERLDPRPIPPPSEPKDEVWDDDLPF